MSSRWRRQPHLRELLVFSLIGLIPFAFGVGLFYNGRWLLEKKLNIKTVNKWSHNSGYLAKRLYESVVVGGILVPLVLFFYLLFVHPPEPSQAEKEKAAKNKAMPDEIKALPEKLRRNREQQWNLDEMIKQRREFQAKNEERKRNEEKNK